MKATGVQCADQAMRSADQVPPISYKVEDCQAFVEATVKRAGGSMLNYAGSNDMYRNACTKIVPLKGAPLQPGMVLFIVAHDGKEPPKYRPDGKGNAKHIGWYTGGRHEVVHSSSSRGGVYPSTLKNAWTHAGWLKAVEYETNPNASQDDDFVVLLQTQLLKLGYDIGKEGVDGDLGPDTEAAIRSFQADNRLTVTGKWSARETALANILLDAIDDFPPEDVDAISLYEELDGIARRLSVIAKTLKEID